MINRGDVEIDGTVLREIREQRLLTQEDFAEEIGMKRNWVGATETAGRRKVLRSKVVEIAKRLKVDPHKLIVHEGQRFERVAMRKVPYFDVKIPASGWVESEPREQPDGWTIIPDDAPPDAFCLRIVGHCMEPDFPSGSVIVFVPIRDGEQSWPQFEDGKAYYFEHSDGKATFKRVFFERAKERYRLEPINPKFRAFYVPEQMKARVSRAVKMMRDVP
ncbi:MAG: XRE family transcriptional regulator [Tepidisphaeraceae bacterium]